MLKVTKNLRFGFFTNGYFTRSLLAINQIRPYAVSTTEQGTIFEKNVVDTFSKFGMKLQCSGGPNDRGIDIQGTWEIDSLSIPLIIQCKNTKKAKPQYVREFVGVIGREYKNRGIPINALHPGDGSAPLGSLCTASRIQNSLLREAALCPYPLILACVGPASILSFQPNYSVLRTFPDLKFVFDINQTDVPTVLFRDKVIMGNK